MVGLFQIHKWMQLTVSSITWPKRENSFGNELRRYQPVLNKKGKMDWENAHQNIYKSLMWDRQQWNYFCFDKRHFWTAKRVLQNSCRIQMSWPHVQFACFLSPHQKCLFSMSPSWWWVSFCELHCEQIEKITSNKIIKISGVQIGTFQKTVSDKSTELTTLLWWTWKKKYLIPIVLYFILHQSHEIDVTNYLIFHYFQRNIGLSLKATY